jgi:predicted transcriptional regulator
MTKAQTIWDYIRRNPIFRVGDIAVITDVEIKTINAYLKNWEKGGFIGLVEDSRNVRNRFYRLTKKSVLAPILAKDGAKERKKMKRKITFESAPYMIVGLKANYSSSVVQVGKYGTIWMDGKRIDRVDLTKDGK